jgi:hypothetical protein
MWGRRAPTHCVTVLYLLRDQKTLVTGGGDGQGCNTLAQKLFLFLGYFESGVLVSTLLFAIRFRSCLHLVSVSSRAPDPHMGRGHRRHQLVDDPASPTHRPHGPGQVHRQGELRCRLPPRRQQLRERRDVLLGHGRREGHREQAARDARARRHPSIQGRNSPTFRNYS